jgi:hypothetical protein
MMPLICWLGAPEGAMLRTEQERERRLEEKLAWMRERMRQKVEKSSQAVQRSLSPARHRRQQRLAVGIPAHLRMFRVSEVAEILGISPQTVRKEFAGRVVVMGQTKTTQSRRRKRILLISQRDLEEWIEEHRGRL